MESRVLSAAREDERFSQADMRALLRLSPGRNILGYSNLLRLLEQGLPEER